MISMKIPWISHPAKLGAELVDEAWHRTQGAPSPTAVAEVSPGKFKDWGTTTFGNTHMENSGNFLVDNFCVCLKMDVFVDVFLVCSSVDVCFFDSCDGSFLYRLHRDPVPLP